MRSFPALCILHMEMMLLFSHQDTPPPFASAQHSRPSTTAMNFTCRSASEARSGHRTCHWGSVFACLHPFDEFSRRLANRDRVVHIEMRWGELLQCSFIVIPGLQKFFCHDVVFPEHLEDGAVFLERFAAHDHQRGGKP